MDYSLLMHPSSSLIISAFVDIYLPQNAKVLEVGSWAPPAQKKVRDSFVQVDEYVGLDIVEGPGVDLLASNPYSWHELFDYQFDAIVSAQVFEHNPFFWLTLLNMSLVLKPGGVMLIVAPSAGKVHRFPLDCWRFYPDASAAMASYACCDILDSGVLEETFPVGGARIWKDWFCVLQKPLHDSGANNSIREILNSHGNFPKSQVSRYKQSGELSLHLESIITARQAV
jgi:SAM-dependent methyltransferase